MFSCSCQLKWLGTQRVALELSILCTCSIPLPLWLKSSPTAGITESVSGVSVCNICLASSFSLSALVALHAQWGAHLVVDHLRPVATQVGALVWQRGPDLVLGAKFWLQKGAQAALLVLWWLIETFIPSWQQLRGWCRGLLPRVRELHQRLLGVRQLCRGKNVMEPGVGVDGYLVGSFVLVPTAGNEWDEYLVCGRIPSSDRWIALTTATAPPTSSSGSSWHSRFSQCG